MRLMCDIERRFITITKLVQNSYETIDIYIYLILHNKNVISSIYLFIFWWLYIYYIIGIILYIILYYIYYIINIYYWL